MIIAASQTTYTPLYISVLLAVMFYMPTIALSNSVAFYALDTNNLDTVKDFLLFVFGELSDLLY